MEITGNMASQMVRETMGAQLINQTLGLANKIGSGNQGLYDMQTKVLGAAMSDAAAAAAVEFAKADTGIGMNIDIVI